MPGEPTNGSPDSEGVSELEQLFEQAAPTAPEMPQVSTDYECSKCGKKCDKQCPTCLGPFCEAHASPYDNHWCCLCLPQETIKESPLTNSEGHTVAGRHLTIGPAYGNTSATRIHQMSDGELATFIQKVKDDIALGARQQDYRHLVLSSAQLEQIDRAANKRVALRQASLRPTTAKKQQSKAVKPQASPAIDFTNPIVLKYMQELFNSTQPTAAQTENKGDAAKPQKPNETH